MVIFWFLFWSLLVPKYKIVKIILKFLIIDFIKEHIYIFVSDNIYYQDSPRLIVEWQ